jgi:hypothetical protein
MVLFLRRVSVWRLRKPVPHGGKSGVPEEWSSFLCRVSVL